MAIKGMLSKADWTSKKMPRAKFPFLSAVSTVDTSLRIADSVLLPFLNPYCLGDNDASSLRSLCRCHRISRSISLRVQEESVMMRYDLAVK